MSSSKELLRLQATTEDRETWMGVDIEYNTGDGQGSAEEWRLLWDRDLSHKG